MFAPKSLDDIDFDARMNIAYHEEMERLCSRRCNGAAFLSVLLASGGVAILEGPWLMALGAVTTLVNLYVLAYSISDRGRQHAHAKAAWYELLMRVADANPNDDTAELRQMYNRISATEPPADGRQLKRAYKRTLAIAEHSAA